MEIETVSVGNESSESQAPDIEISEGDWPMWRGPDQNGELADSNTPVQWSESENVTWKHEIPGRGHASPVIVGDRVFIATADPQKETQSLLCLSRETGEVLWNQVVNQGGLPRIHSKNSQASATPASDGHLVFVTFANHERVQLAAYDMEGALVWDCDAGPYQSDHGFGASPTLFGRSVIVAGDSSLNGFLAAVDRASGDILWRVQRDGPGQRGNYSTPIVATLAGRPQLIQTGYLQTKSYDPSNGELLWTIDGPSKVTANSVASSDPYLLISGGYDEKQILCVKVEGDGTDASVIWEGSRNVSYVPSPVIVENTALLLADDGTLAAFDLETGKQKWRERLGGNFSATPIQVGEKFYVPDEDGTVFVFEVDPEFQLLSKNTLADGGGMSSVSVSDGSLFIRTNQYLYRVDQPKDEAVAHVSESNTEE
ncbi:Outer membrane protein assembly factor BamB precursor [Thalassoglobus neptunius]|uniref:Outer membrane protein assembly factor BamB n=2 Tax=Thalassoglobus neptunius TaxID=1938619 RepID=A0A5C5WZW4_9PLAN|nr:Outer membrane protein assembly factor BamB precursor [Thalassoglobus neptunius]